MRTARLVGPAADGTSLVLVTEDGEELTVALDPDDPAVRSWLGPEPGGSAPAPDEAPAPTAPVRRQPPRRETPMDTPLSPRDIQTRIRAGESLEDLVAGSGMEAERIERFAAPVLAEREHLALTALGSSVRRRGEASGHRPLRSVVAERLQAQGVDGDDVRWDAWKVADSQWQLSADYELQGEPRHAEFRFDAQGRFSTAEDDEARWLAGEAPSPVAASDDRDDELALIRATREPSGHDEFDEPREDETVADAAETRQQVREIAEELGAVLQVVPPAELSQEELAELVRDDPESDGPDDEPDDDSAAQEDAQGSRADHEPTLVVRDEAAEPTIAVVRHLTRVTVEVDEVDEVEVASRPDEPAQTAQTAQTTEADARSALDTLYEMLGGYAEESPRAYAGLSDAAAVPAVDEHEFEPAATVQVPAEPDPEAVEPDPDASAEATGTEAEPTDDAEDTRDAEDTGHAEDTGDGADVQAAEPPVVVVVDEPRASSPEAAGTERPAADAPPATLPEDDEPEPLIPSPGASRKPGRRKRASVPSWDEIMFGGPKPG